MEHVLSRDGTPIAYQRTGTGPPLVLIHCTACDYRIWQPVLPALSNLFTLYAVDRRGRGESGPYGDNYSVACEYEDIIALVDMIGEPVSLLGYSSGARYALHAALRMPLVQRLVLYEPPPFALPSPAIMAHLHMLQDRNDRDAIVTMFMRDMMHTSPAALPFIQRMPIWEMMVANAHTILPELRSFRDYLFDPMQFAQFRVPVLCLLGSASPPFMKAETEAVAAALPNSQIVPLPGQSHGAVQRAPDLFVREVVQFLR